MSEDVALQISYKSCVNFVTVAFKRFLCPEYIAMMMNDDSMSPLQISQMQLSSPIFTRIGSPRINSESYSSSKDAQLDYLELEISVVSARC